jgi:hypothetical protein
MTCSVARRPRGSGQIRICKADHSPMIPGEPTTHKARVLQRGSGHVLRDAAETSFYLMTLLLIFFVVGMSASTLSCIVNFIGDIMVAVVLFPALLLPFILLTVQHRRG